MRRSSWILVWACGLWGGSANSAGMPSKHLLKQAKAQQQQCGVLWARAQKKKARVACAKAAVSLGKWARQHPRHRQAGAMLFKSARLYQKVGMWAKSARTYHAMAHRYPRHRGAAIALYNAAFGFEKIKRVGTAMMCYKHLVGAYPQSPQAWPSYRRLLALHLGKKQHKRALAIYMRLVHSRRWARHSRERKLLLGGLIHLLAQQKKHRKAADHAILFVRRHPRSPRAPGFLYFAGQRYRLAGHKKKALGAWKRLLKRRARSPQERALKRRTREAIATLRKQKR